MYFNSFPVDFHTSIARTISDQFYLATAEIDYGVTYFHIMETTKFLSASAISHQPRQWPIWSNAQYVFESSISTVDGGMSDYSTHKLMLFSSNDAAYSKYMGGLAADAIPLYFPSYADGGSHDSKRMVRFLVNWACQLNEPTCLAAAATSFKFVSSGSLTWSDLNVNYREYVRPYAVRHGDVEDIQYLIDELFTENNVELNIDALSYMPTDYSNVATDLFDFYNENAELLTYALTQFVMQPPMRDVAIGYITGLHATDNF